MKPSATCKDEHRREDVREEPPLNGLDYIEVSEDQLTLDVYFLGKAPEHIGVANVRIEGGRRVRDLRVRDVHVHRNPNPELDDRMEVTVDKPGGGACHPRRALRGILVLPAPLRPTVACK